MLKLILNSFLFVQVKVALHPYLQLTQAVKSGDLVRFADVVKNFADQFNTDHTYTLIMRLHHNVVKTAVRTISLAYSKITFADIAQKLLLDSPEDAEFIVAKVSSTLSKFQNIKFMFRPSVTVL